MTTFLIDYFKAIDLLALAGLAALACAALFRNGSVWPFTAGVIVAVWGTMRVLAGLGALVTMWAGGAPGELHQAKEQWSFRREVPGDRRQGFTRHHPVIHRHWLRGGSGSTLV